MGEKGRRSKIHRDKGMTAEEFQRLSREEKLERAKKWDGRTKEFDAAQEYQFSYEQFCRLLLGCGIANVSRVGWMYVSELDKGSNEKVEETTSATSIKIISIDMSKKMSQNGKTIRVAPETFERWDSLMKDCKMPSRVLDALMCDYMDQIDAREIQVVTRVI